MLLLIGSSPWISGGFKRCHLSRQLRALVPLLLAVLIWGAARLSVTDVRVAHGSHVLCAPVSLSIGAGEIVALTAPSGAGKTSVIRRELRRRFGWIPQESELALNPHVAIRSLLVRTGASQEQITALLDELELPIFLCREHRRLRADDLSGGQRQRVSVALSLLGGPDLLLADEPTSALDSHSARLVLAAIRAHRAPHAAVLIASHDSVVLEIADRVVALGRGGSMGRGTVRRRFVGLSRWRLALRR